MASPSFKRILFVVNANSGTNEMDWVKEISAFFDEQDEVEFSVFELPEKCDVKDVQNELESFKPNLAVAVGGDGTVKLVAECLLQTDVALGIIPAGSANGLAKELGIPAKPEEAFQLLLQGKQESIHVIKINDELCVHLSDIGFNANLIKKFDAMDSRGMWGYLKASLKVLFNNPTMEVRMQVNNETTIIKAAMIVIANATKYGTGAVINPVGELDDKKFEVIALKKLSLSEIFKMSVLKTKHNPGKTTVYQTSSVIIHSRKPVHFQVDGEYLGKVRKIKADILPAALQVIVPAH